MKLTEHKNPTPNPSPIGRGTAGAQLLGRIGEYVKIHGTDLGISIQLIVKAVGSEGTVKSAISRKNIVSVGRGWYSFRSLEGYNGWGGKVMENVESSLLTNPTPTPPQKGGATLTNMDRLRMMLKMEMAEAEVVEMGNKEADLEVLWNKFKKITDAHYYYNKHGVAMKRAFGLAESVAVYRFLDGTRWGKVELKKATGYEKREDLYRSAIVILKTKELPLVPLSYDRLRTDVDAFGQWKLAKNRVDMDWFVDERKGNINNMVIGKPSYTMDDIMLENSNINMAEWHANTLAMLYMNPGRANKFDFEELYTRYKRKCVEWTQEAQSLSAIKRFLSQEVVQTYVTWERNGYSEFDKLLPTIRGKKPMYALNKCGIDGFQVDFRTDTGTASVMLTCVVVVDYMSECASGFAIGFTETSKLVRDAYRMHLKMYGGKTYNEIDMDGSMANTCKKSMELLEQVSKKVNTSMSDDPSNKHRSNSKSRYVERLIQEINRLSQSMVGWKGTNITSIDRNRKPNPDYMKGNALKGLAEGTKQVVQLLNIYNSEKLDKLKGMSRAETMESYMHPEAEVIDELTQARMLLERRVLTIRGGLIQIEIDKKKYEYELKDWHLHRARFAKGDKVAVYMDETDMAQIDIWGWKVDNNDNPIETYIATVQELSRVFRDVASQTDADKEALAEQMGRRKRMLGDVERKQLEIEAKNYGLELALYGDIKELRKAVEGGRMTQKTVVPMEERFEEELASEHSERVDRYFESPLTPEGGTAGAYYKTVSKIDHWEKFNKYKEDEGMFE